MFTFSHLTCLRNKITWMDGWQFYAVFNSITIIMGLWNVGYKRLCAKEVNMVATIGRCYHTIHT